MQKKLLIVPFIAMIILSIIFISTQIPMAKMEPKKLPIGFVVLDEGPMGKTISENLQKALNANEVVKVKQFNDEQSLQKAFKNREIYGAIEVPVNFSSAIQSLATPNPQEAVMNYYINEGENNTVSTMLTTMFNQMNTQMNAMVRTQLASQFTEVPVALVETLVEPVKAKVQKVNPTGALASAPAVFFQPVWFAAILGAVILFIAGRKSQFASKKEQLQLNGLQTLVGIVYAFVAGYFITWCTTWIVGFEFTNFHTVALFSSIACLAFLFLIQACVTWFNLPVIVVFVLLMFYGLPLIQLAPEMLPAFYANFIVSWIPFKFLIEGMKDILFFGKDLSNTNVTVLLVMFVVSLILLWVKFAISKHVEKSV